MPRSSPYATGTRFLLTWSAVTDLSISVATIITHILSFSDPDWIEVCQEFHEDGAPHYHAIVVYESRIRRTLTAFNLPDFNANVAVIAAGRKHLHDTRAYIRKELAETAAKNTEEGRILWDTHGNPPPFDPNWEPEETGRNHWGEALQAATQDEFLEVVRRNHPREYVVHYFNILAFAQHHYNVASTYVPEYPADSFRVPAAMHDWVDEVLGEVSIPATRYSRMTHFFSSWLNRILILSLIT